MAFKYKLKEEPFNVGDTETKGGIKTTITDLDPETGAVTWDVKNVPAIDSTFKEFKELVEFVWKSTNFGYSEIHIEKPTNSEREIGWFNYIMKNYNENSIDWNNTVLN